MITKRDFSKWLVLWWGQKRGLLLGPGHFGLRCAPGASCWNGSHNRAAGGRAQPAYPWGPGSGRPTTSTGPRLWVQRGTETAFCRDPRQRQPCRVTGLPPALRLASSDMSLLPSPLTCPLTGHAGLEDLGGRPLESSRNMQTGSQAGRKLCTHRSAGQVLCPRGCPAVCAGAVDVPGLRKRHVTSRHTPGRPGCPCSDRLCPQRGVLWKRCVRSLKEGFACCRTFPTFCLQVGVAHSPGKRGTYSHSLRGRLGPSSLTVFPGNAHENVLRVVWGGRGRLLMTGGPRGGLGTVEEAGARPAGIIRW